MENAKIDNSMEAILPTAPPKDEKATDAPDDKTPSETAKKPDAKPEKKKAEVKMTKK